MATRISIDGVIYTPEEARVPVLDRGFLFGDSVYEVLRTCGGAPFALPEHLSRLRRSAEGIALAVPWEDEELSAELEATLRAAQNEESYIRIVVTRGEGEEIGLDPALAQSPRRIFVVKPFPRIPRALYEQGAKAALVRLAPGPLAGVKTGNYLANIMAVREARQKGAYEAWMVDEAGRLTEGANSNIFLVKDGRLATPPLGAGILEGITRRKVIELAKREQIPLKEREVSITDAFAADEAFLTSSLREIMPVTEIDGRKVGDGKVGAVTQRLRQKFRDLCGGRSPGD